MTPFIDAGALGTATLRDLSASRYSKAYIYAILGLEESALYQWQRGGEWSKSTVPVSPRDQGLSFWEFRNDPNLLNDPDRCDREVERFFAERNSEEHSS
jgi:hypothetical protein